MAVHLISTNPKPHFNLLFLLLVISMPGCFSVETTTDEEKVVLESSNSGTHSLHTTGVCTTTTCEGEDCAASGCHNVGSDILPLAISGSVFQFQDLNLPYDNTVAAIEFYSGPGGSGDLLKTLELDTLGNFYSTEPLSAQAYPALRYEDNRDINNPGIVRRVYMPRPAVPISANTCNACHQLVQPPTVLPPIEEQEFFYLRLNNGIISSSDPDIDYHPDGDRGRDCLQSTCHGAGSTATTVFSMAGVVMQTETNTAYSLGDAVIELYVEECDDQRYGCQEGIAPEDVVFRSRAPKTFVEVNRRGHFYTTQPINWQLSTYATLTNYNANTFCRNIKHMVPPVPPVNTGNCYACHNGTTQPLITIKGILDPDDPDDPNDSFEQCARTDLEGPEPPPPL